MLSPPVKPLFTYTTIARKLLLHRAGTWTPEMVSPKLDANTDRACLVKRQDRLLQLHPPKKTTNTKLKPNPDLHSEKGCCHLTTFGPRWPLLFPESAANWFTHQSLDSHSLHTYMSPFFSPSLLPAFFYGTESQTITHAGKYSTNEPRASPWRFLNTNLPFLLSEMYM